MKHFVNAYITIDLSIYKLASCSQKYYIRKMPNLVGGMGALRAALKLRAKTFRVSAGSITPSSHSRAEE